MPRGYLSLILHAHLPFIRHPEYAEFLEERWLFEAIADCYLPLLDVFERLAGEAVPHRVTVSISPTLAAMLDDDLLRKRCRAWLEDRRDKSKKSAPFVAAHYEKAAGDFERRGGSILEPFLELQRKGGIEIVTTAATHAFLPLLKNHPPSVRAQIRVALDEHILRFGNRPRGFWLPECGFYPGLQSELAAAGIEYFIVDAHGFFSAQPSPPFGPLSPVACEGVAAFARDPDSAREVWAPDGFPSSVVYRDFHEADADGFKTRAVSGRVAKKFAYDPAEAKAAAVRHAEEFVRARIARSQLHGERLPHPPLMVAAYDAELFGHWWYEGVQFIEHVLRFAAARRDEIETITPSGFLDRYPPEFAAVPGASSWGQHGFNDYWLNESNHWIYPELRRAASRLAQIHAAGCCHGAANVRARLQCRATKQAARSLLLAQASDWPFMMTRGTSASYAGKRLRDQLARVGYLCDAIEKNDIKERRLRALEKMDNLFPHLDCRHFMEA